MPLFLHLFFFHTIATFCRLSGQNLHGVPSRDLKSYPVSFFIRRYHCSCKNCTCNVFHTIFIAWKKNKPATFSSMSNFGQGRHGADVPKLLALQHRQEVPDRSHDQTAEGVLSWQVSEHCEGECSYAPPPFHTTPHRLFAFVGTGTLNRLTVRCV